MMRGKWRLTKKPLMPMLLGQTNQSTLRDGEVDESHHSSCLCPLQLTAPANFFARQSGD
jgi:hypothetical protein